MFDKSSVSDKDKIKEWLQSYLDNGYNLAITFTFNENRMHNKETDLIVLDIQNKLNQLCTKLDNKFIQQIRQYEKRYGISDNGKRDKKHYELIRELLQSRYSENENYGFQMIGVCCKIRDSKHFHGVLKTAKGFDIQNDVYRFHLINKLEYYWKQIVRSGNFHIANERKNFLHKGKYITADNGWVDYITEHFNLGNINRNTGNIIEVRSIIKEK